MFLYQGTVLGVQSGLVPDFYLFIYLFIAAV